MTRTPATPLVIDGRSWTMLFGLGAIWGGSFFFARIAVQDIAPMTLAFLRVTIAALALVLVVSIKRQWSGSAVKRWPEFLILGLLNNVVPFSLIFWGQTEIGAGLASIINATTPFWTALLATVVTADDKLSGRKLAGILIGLAGVLVLSWPRLQPSSQLPLWPLASVLGATMSYAFAGVFARRFRGERAVVVAAGQLSASTLILLPVAVVTGGLYGLANVHAEVWGAVLALALLATAYAYILYFTLIARAGASNAALVTLIVPVSAILLGVLFLGEGLAATELAGLVVIAAGFLVIDGRVLPARARS